MNNIHAPIIPSILLAVFAMALAVFVPTSVELPAAIDTLVILILVGVIIMMIFSVLPDSEASSE